MVTENLVQYLAVVNVFIRRSLSRIPGCTFDLSIELFLIHVLEAQL